VEIVEGPNDTDLREGQYTAALLARDASFDLVYMDLTWTPKFAAAGWLRELDDVLGAADRNDLLPAALEAGRFRGHLYRLPVRTDVGVLYRREDLLAAAGLEPPKSLDDLVRTARAVQSPPRLWGFAWPGAQYEGLVCVYLEILRAYGGVWIDAATLEVGLDKPAAEAALEFLRRCVAPPGISPPGVTAFKEEETRRLFQDGRAVFMRNWTYAWRLAGSTGSDVAGRMALQPMVGTAAGTGAGTLGGWGFGISRYSRHADLAAAFVRHALSVPEQRALALGGGYLPVRRSALADPELVAANPLLPELVRLHETAVVRPAIPRYALASDILQRHVSAALAGLAAPRDALARAADETRRLLEGGAR
jgi:multiple sugar transport system substrate-binding protein